MVSPKQIAVLYFSRSARLEGSAKAWFSGRAVQKNTALAEVLIQKTADALALANLPVYHCHEGKQNGHTFGEKIANAYQEVFSQGYQAVIAVGNDTPGLDQLDWASIKASLLNGQSVIGPSQRGGAYLIGIPKSNFSKAAFQDLPWQSSALMPALVNLCAANEINALCLPVLRDLNTGHDLKKLVDTQWATEPLAKALRIFLAQCFSLIRLQLPEFNSLIAIGTRSYRGPPSLLLQ